MSAMTTRSRRPSERIARTMPPAPRAGRVPSRTPCSAPTAAGTYATGAPIAAHLSTRLTRGTARAAAAGSQPSHPTRVRTLGRGWRPATLRLLDGRVLLSRRAFLAALLALLGGRAGG